MTMILKEISVERFIFTCTGCGHAWVADYDAQHVEDGHGHARDYFFRDGVQCPDPTGPGETICPHCGRASVLAHLSARRASPAVTDKAPEGPGEMPTSARTAARAKAPLLPGAQ
jgi:hypothetical protein